MHIWNSDGERVSPAISGRQGYVDSYSGAQETIAFSHHEIHEGHSFIIEEGIQLNNASKIYLIETPNTPGRWANLVIFVSGSQDTSVSFQEGTTYSTGTLMEPINRNRNSTHTAETIVSHTPVGAIGSGTTLFTAQWGLAAAAGGRGGSGGDRAAREEYILREATKYVITVTALSANPNNITVSIEWYEHDNSEGFEETV